MKKIIVASLLAVGSMAYAGTIEHDTRALPDLGADAPISCGMPVECSKLSPLKRGICILYSLGQVGCTFVCGAGCLFAHRALSNREQLDNKGKLLCAGLFIGALIGGADTLHKSVRNISTAMMD